jgi:hypothetical protein
MSRHKHPLSIPARYFLLAAFAAMGTLGLWAIKGNPILMQPGIYLALGIGAACLFRGLMLWRA